MKELLAYMLGPKAENLDLFKKLLVEALDDHLYWRRNFYPEDSPIVRAPVQSSKEFVAFVDKLHDGLFEFLDEAKQGVPFFSARYLGHMNTDLLIPALVGYFAAMLYNQNNVAGESSPVTVKLEGEVIAMLCKMVGFDPTMAFGYLSSGGTAANFYALWVARNLRAWPLALRLTASCNPADETIEALRAIGAETRRRPLSEQAARDLSVQARKALGEMTALTATGPLGRLGAMTGWDLLNLPIDETCRLRGAAVLEISARADLGQEHAARVLDHLALPFSMKSLGDQRFRTECTRIFSKEQSLFAGIPWVVCPDNTHYSWRKAVDLLGLGQAALKFVSHGAAFDVDVAALEQCLRGIVARKEGWPLAVVSVFGTTEEGALDNLPAVGAMLANLQRELGVTCWWHVDGAYGGYLPTMLRAHLDDPGYTPTGTVDDPETLKGWLVSCCEGVGVSRQEAVELVELSERSDGRWLSWSELANRAESLRLADSITLDPHKLGYVPYPSGAVLLKRSAAREMVSSDAPYLWVDGADPSGFTGRYTLEGSRPGAAAAACWLAHKLVPLDQSGHGRLIALSILGVRKLYLELRSRFAGGSEGPKLAVPHQPHTNMLCYIPYHTDLSCVGGETNADSLRLVKALTRRIQQAHSPTNQVRPFMAVDTTLDIPADTGAFRAFDPNESLTLLLERAGGDRKLQVIRSVVMGPFALAARSKPTPLAEGRPLLGLFATNLFRSIERANEELHRDEFAARASVWPRHLNTMLMDDDPSVTGQLRALIPELNHFKIADFWKSFETEAEALRLVTDYNVPLDIAFLDIDMSGSTQNPKGASDSGYRVYDAILARNAAVPPPFRVQLVVFFTKGFMTHCERVNEIAARHPAATVEKVKIPKSAFGSAEQRARREALAAARRIISRIARLEIVGVEAL